MYPAPPPLKAPEVDKGAPLSNLTSPLAADQAKPTRTAIDSEAEAQLFVHATRIVWGRYAKIKGAKPGAAVVTKQGALWTIKGRLDSVAPGSEGDWASIDGVVERIAASKVQIRGEVAFRVAKVQNGTPCKVAGTAALPPLRQVAGLAPRRGRQSLRRHAGAVRPGLREARPRRSRSRPSRSG